MSHSGNFGDHDASNNNNDDDNGTRETSPLMSPVKPGDHFHGHEEEEEQQQQRQEEEDLREEMEFLAKDQHDVLHDQQSKSTLHLFLLTLSIGGLQVVWSVELSNGSPFLLSLGMSKALLAIVWVAGPLTGTLVQPYIGIRSDNCRLSWGKRKPFMIAGGAATIFCLMLLSWVREIVGGVLGVFGADQLSDGVKITTIVIATILMFCLDFAINTVQAGIRAFIVDCAPAHQQESANAWASRQTGAGNILGYILAYMDLPSTFPFFGNTQFKVLCLVASVSLGITLLISCLYIKERDPRLEGPPPSGSLGLISFARETFRSIRGLPPQIRKVCEVQLAAWIGWFPFLYYSTTYIGQIYVNPIFEEHRNLSDDDINKAWEDATRIGSFALLVNAIICFSSNIILPILIVPSYRRIQAPTDTADFVPAPSAGERRGSLSENPENIASEPLLEQRTLSSKGDDETTNTWSSILKKLRIPGLTLRRTWLSSHVLFAICMFSTFFITSTWAATVVIGIIGISWAVTLWAPFALISAEVAQRDAERRLNRLQAELANAAVESDRDHHDDEEDIEQSPRIVGAETGSTDQAGIVLGLHNVAISMPQILSTLVSGLIFKALQKPRGEPWDDSVGWVMRFGGCAALIAAFLTRRLDEKGSK